MSENENRAKLFKVTRFALKEASEQQLVIPFQSCVLNVIVVQEKLVLLVRVDTTEEKKDTINVGIVKSEEAFNDTCYKGIYVNSINYKQAYIHVFYRYLF